MFSAIVLDHFYNPRNCGPIEGATHEGVAGSPGDGPYMILQFDVDAEGIVRRAAYRTYGCPATSACGSMLCEMAVGRRALLLLDLTATELMQVLGGLPEGREHCAERTIAA